MTAANMRARRCVFSYHVTSLALKKKKKKMAVRLAAVFRFHRPLVGEFNLYLSI